MNLPSLPRHGLILVALGGILALLAAASARAQAHASASAYNYLSGSDAPSGSATPLDLSISHQEARFDGSGSSVDMHARGYAVTGVVGATASTRIHGSNGNSGSVSATATGSWQDRIDLTLPERFTLENLGWFELKFNVSATGSVHADRSLADDGNYLAAGNAQIDYDFTFSGARYLGMQSEYGVLSNGIFPPQGTWGTITGTAAVTPGNSVGLSMFGRASTDMGNFYAGGSRDATSYADFGSTLIWGGITGVTAFNVSGQQIVLPDDFQLDLIGRQSGFNYWHAAKHPDDVGAPAGVPDSTPVMLLLAPAMLGLVLIRRRERAGPRSR